MTKSKFHIDKDPFAELKYYSGSYNKKFSFTLVIQVYGETNIKFVQEIVWVDKKPIKFKEVEKQIEGYWMELDPWRVFI